ncbi:alpha/beta hydrolase family protein [Psychromarinibacter halotolerans]|uniref:Alpha/beta hydrolase family protein n=1 Tax=Psychromarinibacter halotolerans TaxID=1775175 RepID=A0ABV7GM47_9RHOB|nr:dienelactone hydrolase family protein [Psychromarinibacter halotolerans]MDF0597274.1 dienelactone hydrolase family protein [Psychromarinibacter halotolerans]
MTPDALRTRLQRLTGWDPRPAAAVSRKDAAPEAGHPVETLVLRGPRGPMPATLIRPETAGPLPAVLYCHAHGGDYRLGRREMLEGSRFLHTPGYGIALANAGFAALCVDMTGFGDRRDEGDENDMAKALFWRGESLFGHMLNDLGAAFGYLAERPDVDAARIFTLGLSMGAAHAYWLAALEPRVAGCAHLCMLADIGPMIDAGAHARHGFYLSVPGLLPLAETGDIAGLIAPRPQFACHGGTDHLTPPAARDTALARLRAAYAGHDDRLTCAIDPAAGHGETAPMRVAVLDFLAQAAARGHQDFG